MANFESVPTPSKDHAPNNNFGNRYFANSAFFRNTDKTVRSKPHLASNCNNRKRDNTKRARSESQHLKDRPQNDTEDNCSCKKKRKRNKKKNPKQQEHMLLSRNGGNATAPYSPDNKQSNTLKKPKAKNKTKSSIINHPREVKKNTFSNDLKKFNRDKKVIQTISWQVDKRPSNGNEITILYNPPKVKIKQIAIPLQTKVSSAYRTPIPLTNLSKFHWMKEVFNKRNTTNLGLNTLEDIERCFQGRVHPLDGPIPFDISQNSEEAKAMLSHMTMTSSGCNKECCEKLPGVYNLLIGRIHDLELRVKQLESDSIERKTVQKEQKSNYVGFIVDKCGRVVVKIAGVCLDAYKVGIGVWFAKNHPMNLSSLMRGRASETGAQLQAIHAAIELAIRADIKKLLVCIRSNYVLELMSELQKYKYNLKAILRDSKFYNNAEEWIKLATIFKMKIKVEFRKSDGNFRDDEAHNLAELAITNYKTEPNSHLFLY